MARKSKRKRKVVRFKKSSGVKPYNSSTPEEIESRWEGKDGKLYMDLALSVGSKKLYESTKRLLVVGFDIEMKECDL